MKRIIFLSEKWVIKSEAVISCFDRRFHFADSVYYVVSVINGKLLNFDCHLELPNFLLQETGITTSCYLRRIA